MKNRKLVLTLFAFSAAAYLGSDMDVAPPQQSRQISSVQKTILKAPASAVVSKADTTPPLILTAVPETEGRSFTKSAVMQKSRSRKTFSTRVENALPKGLTLATEIFAIKKSDFNSGLGNKVLEKDGFVYFHSDVRPSNVANVAVDERNGNLHAVSSIIKLSNIDEHMRESLLSKGLQEHYYAEDLNVLYLQTTQEEVFELHSLLAYENLHPEIEVNRAYRKIR